MPQNTFRVWIVGFIMSTVAIGINTYFIGRTPAVSLGASALQVLTYPFGVFLAWALPTREFRIFGRQVSLNPGPFNVKEHGIITLIATVSASTTYMTNIIYVLRIPRFFNRPDIASPFGFQILLTLATQLMGYALAGITRRFLVYPPEMIWFGTLETVALNRSLHDKTNHIANGWKISRYRFFWVVFFLYFCYYVFPFAIFQNLSNFNWMVWIAPSNKTYATITGSQVGGSGLGLTLLTSFDWSWIAYWGSPNVNPLFVSYNLAFGALCVFFPIVVGILFSNSFYTKYMPGGSLGIYDNTGNSYNISRVVTPDLTLNVTAYQEYSPVFQSATNITTFCLFFALYTATVFTGIFSDGSGVLRQIKRMIQNKDALKSGRHGFPDIHNRLMFAYKEVPEWWYASLLLICIVFACVGVEVYNTEMPIWGIFFCIALALITILPIGVLYARTNQLVTLNVLAEIIAGYAIPNRPIANMLFKTFGINVNMQALSFVSDLKFGHYVKIAPRIQFWSQLLATIWACFVSLGVTDWKMATYGTDPNSPNALCTRHNSARFLCNDMTTFFNSAVQWGVIGPQRLYSQGTMYFHILWTGFVFGAIIPVFIAILSRKYPRSFWHYVNFPVMLYAGLDGALMYVFSYLFWAVFFQAFIFRRFNAWWVKYNYILAAALDSGAALGAFFWFFVLLFRSGIVPEDWWGNAQQYAGCEGSGCTLLDPSTAPGGFFGPRTWE